jgi:hypothetical protein
MKKKPVIKGKKNHNKIKHKSMTKKNTNIISKSSIKQQKKTKKYKSNKTTKSQKYKSYLQNRIKFNITQFKKGIYKSQKQAIAISYNQTNKQFNQ